MQIVLSYHGNYFGPGSGTYDAIDHYHTYVGDAQQRPIQHVPSHILLKGKLSHAQYPYRWYWPELGMLIQDWGFSAVTGHWRVAYGLFPLFRHGPCRVLRHRLLLQSPVKTCESCSCSTHLYRRKFTNKSFRTTSRPLMRLGGKHCPPRKSEESSAYFGWFCRSFTRCFARPSGLPSWRLGKAKRMGPPCRGTRSKRWWRRFVP